MKQQPPPKTRTYEIAPRHLLPMLRDLAELATIHIARKKSRRHVIQLGRDACQTTSSENVPPTTPRSSRPPLRTAS
jgi:hypothetical protein